MDALLKKCLPHETTVRITKAIKVELTPFRMMQAKTNAKGWRKNKDMHSTWGIGKGIKDDIDIATFQGCKGEQAMAQQYNWELSNEVTMTPNHIDYVNPLTKRRWEIKTGSLHFLKALIKAQTCDRNGTFHWITRHDQDSINGLFADDYVFCRSSDLLDDPMVEIWGWISREEILQKFGILQDAMRKNASGKPEWKNYVIPYSDLHDMSLLSRSS